MNSSTNVGIQVLQGESVIREGFDSSVTLYLSDHGRLVLISSFTLTVPSGVPMEVGPSVDWHAEQLVRLIGDRVERVSISPGGGLQLEFGSGTSLEVPEQSKDPGWIWLGDGPRVGD